MKKFILMMLIGLIASTAAFGFLGFGKKNKLYIYNWSEYIPEEVLEDFEKEFDIKLIYDVYSSNEEMYAKLKAGGGGYDIVFPSSDFVSIMTKEGMLEKIDKTKLSNYKNIDQRVMEMVGTYDRGGMHSIPFSLGGTGIAVNTKYVKNYKRDFSIYLNEDYKGKMILLDDMREVIGSALSTLGYSSNSTDPAEIAKAKELVLKWKQNIVKFDAESFGKGFANEEFLVVHGYAENVFTEIDDEMRQYVDFFIPEIGGAAYIDSMVVLKESKNKDLAYKFINYILRPEVNAKIVDYLEVPSIIKGVKDIRETTPVYPLEQVLKAELKFDLGDAIELYNQTWQEIVIEN